MSRAIEITKEWLEETIIALNLCPFAAEPHKNKQILTTASKAKSFDELYEVILLEIKQITSTNITTTLIALENMTDNFQEFYNICEDLNEIFKATSQGFQVVAFHPNFQFQGTDFDDKVNYVNRSPLPVIHIINSLELQQAMNNTEIAENISLNNEKKIKSLSQEELNKYFPYIK